MTGTGESIGSASVGVVGLGNLLLTDEGLGVHAVRMLADRPVDGVRYVDGGTDPWTAMERVRGCRALILLDALVGGKQPGEFHSLPCEDVEAGDAALSLHGITMLHLLAYERVLGTRFDEVWVLGMEPHLTAPGVGLSECCQQRLPAFVEMVARHIRQIQERLSAREGRRCLSPK